MHDTAPTNRDLRLACIDIIKSVQPDSVVFPRLVQGFDKGKCPDVLRNADGKINCWIIFPASEDRDDMPDTETGTVYLDTLTLNVWFLLEFEHGDDDDNSEDRFETERRKVVDAFSKSPWLGWEGWVLGHSELSFETIVLHQYTNALVHVALGKIAVAVQTFLPLE